MLILKGLSDGLLAAGGVLISSWRYFCCHVRGGVCCQGECHCDEGDCCGDIWFPAGEECDEGFVYLRWGPNNECCGCIEEQINAGVLGMLNAVDIKDEFCCPLCPGGQLYPYDTFTGDYIGCVSRCCIDGNCSDQWPADCLAAQGQVLTRCCFEANGAEVGCPKPCCSEDSSGNVQCEVREQPLCQPPALVANSCETGCVGECCDAETGVSLGQKTQPECEEIDGLFQGIGSTECAGPCRDPYTTDCCERKQSKAAGLTFYQPRKKRQPPFEGTVRARVRGQTSSPILVHGIPVSPTDGSPYERCPFDVTFLLCWDAFNIEPVPCGTNFTDLDVTVCWEQETTLTEVLKFSGCDVGSCEAGITVWLGYCPYSCVTTLLYEGTGHTSNANIELRGNAIIEANGTGPLVLICPIKSLESCVETLTITGFSTEDNEIQVIEDSSSGLDVIKRGVGLWRLNGQSSYSGQLQVLEGTLVVASNVPFSGGSPFGTETAFPGLPTIGDYTKTALLLADGVTIERGMTVPSTAGSVTLGGTGVNTSVFANGTSIRLGMQVTLRADTGGTVIFANAWEDEFGGESPAVAITINAVGHAGTVVLDSFLPESIISLSVIVGTAQIAGVDNRIDKGIPVTIVSGTLDINGLSQELEEIAFTGEEGLITGGTLVLSGPAQVSASGFGHEIASAVTLNAEAAISVGDELLVSGGISGGYGIIKSGEGILTLAAANDYTGETTINDGTLSLSGAGSIEDSDEVVCDGVFSISATASGTSIRTLSGVGSVILGSKDLTFTAASTDFSGVISGSGDLVFDSGTLTLSGENTFTGTAEITSGQLALSDSGSIEGAAMVVCDGVFSISATTSGATIKALTGSGSVLLGDQSLTLTEATGTFSGGVSGGGAVVLDGGAQTFSGANSYSGGTTINYGAMIAGSVNAFGTGPIVVNPGGTLNKNGFAITNTITNNGGTVID